MSDLKLTFLVIVNICFSYIVCFIYVPGNKAVSKNIFKK